MLTNFKKHIVPKLAVSLVIFLSFFVGLILFNHSPFTTDNFIALYAIPILLYSIVRHPSSLKKQLRSDILLSVLLAFPVSLGIGYLVGSVAFDAETVEPFDYYAFWIASIGFFLWFSLIAYITLFIGAFLRATLLKKLPIFIIH